MSVRTVCVLRTGGEFHVGHVEALARMVHKHMDGATLWCLSDDPAAPNRIPLEYDWPGWWAKLELCRPDIGGPLLFIDLDAVIVGGLAPLVADASRSIVVRDFYRAKKDPQAVQSCFMLLTEADRAAVWRVWSRGAERWMKRAKNDQYVFQEALADRVAFWQDTYPGKVVGYKTDIRGKRETPHPDTSVVCFHGRPRPWDSGEAWAEGSFA